MNGILVIDKPAGITSHDVVSRVRRILKTRRVGHTGTLDPFATGVMVILVGRATRLAQFLDKDEKEYQAAIRFGFETDTGDHTGSRIADRGIRDEEIDALLSDKDWKSVFAKFRGEIDQVPPMFSAKKIDGKKLYEHARKGETVKRAAAKVTISKLELIEPEQIHDPRSEIRIQVVCSAGTYIRTLAEDIGREVGVGAHLSELRRTRAGRFDLSQAVTIEHLAEMDEPQSRLLAMDEAVSHLPILVFDDDRISKTLNGLSTRIADSGLEEGDAVRMADAAGKLIAIGVFVEAENSVRPKVVLV